MERPGEISPTCGECHSLPDYCDCPPPADPLPDEPKTELGYARRLVHVYGAHLRYVAAWRRWLVWDGRRWAHDATGQAHAVDEDDSPPDHRRRPGDQATATAAA